MSNKMERREFLKLTAAFLTSLVLPSCVPQGQQSEGTFRWGLKDLSISTVNNILERIKIGTKDSIGEQAFAILTALNNRSLLPQAQFSTHAVGNFHFFDVSGENNITSETGAYRPNKQYIVHKEDIPPLMTDHFVEGFSLGIGFPSAQIKSLNNEEITYAVAKELTTLGMIDGITNWLFTNSNKGYSIVSLSTRKIVANYQNLTDEQKYQVGLSLFYMEVGSGNINNRVWKVHDLLPTFIIASGIQKMEENSVIPPNMFNNIKIFAGSIEYMKTKQYNGQNLPDFLYQTFYLDMANRKSFRSDPTVIMPLLTDNTFINLITNYNGPGYGSIFGLNNTI